MWKMTDAYLYIEFAQWSAAQFDRLRIFLSREIHFYQVEFQNLMDIISKNMKEMGL